MKAPFRLLGDDRLVRLAQAGSEPAFAAIYGRYGRILHGYCRSLVEDEHDARDALQNTMLKAFTAMRANPPKGPLRPWLFRIAHNESMSLLRQRARMPVALDDRMAATGPDTHRQAEARERLATVLEDMKGLTSHQRGALVMRELGGMGYDEIGTALETSPLAARQAVFAARRALGHVPRASLRAALLPPVPAGAAILAAVLGGGGSAASAGGGSLAVKAIATAATVGIGLGAVEVAREVPVSPERADRVAAVAPAEPAEDRVRKVVAKPKRVVAAPVAREVVAAAPPVAVAVVAKPAVVKREQAVAPVRRERPKRERRDEPDFIEDEGLEALGEREGGRRSGGGERREFAAREDCPDPPAEQPAAAPEAPAPEQPAPPPV